MDKKTILDWCKQEFQPVDLVTTEETIYQITDNAIRYFNAYSAFKYIEMVTATSGSTKVAVSANIKNVIRVLPATPPTTILMNYPIWSLLGIAILDNVTNDMIAMTESFKNYKYYIGADFRWRFERNEDPTLTGNLYLTNVPENTTKLCVIGTRRLIVDSVTGEYSIVDEYILNWLLRYIKALVKKNEGNVLRKSDIIGVKNDGQDLYNEGKEEEKDLQEELRASGRWTSFITRF